MSVINIHEAKTHLSQLIHQVLAGEQVIIAKAGKPLVELTIYHPEKTLRKGGQLRGMINIGDDFDDPLPEEITKSFHGESE